MPGKVIHIDNIKGLDEHDIPALQEEYGKNIFEKEYSGTFFRILRDIVKELLEKPEANRH